MYNDRVSGSHNLEGGLALVGSVTIAVLMLMLCACFERKRGNGRLFISSRRSSGTEVEDDVLHEARATSHRRLPDIPDPLVGGSEDPIVRQNSVRSSQDNSSELYAQVEIGPHPNSFPVNLNPAEDAEASRNSAGPSNRSQLDEEEIHPYDKLKANSHGYSKIKKKAENPYAKVKRSDTMESEAAEADENETDTDNYDVVYTLHTVDETKKSPESINVTANSENSTHLLPPPLPLPLRGSHSSLASGESAAPRPPPRGRRVSSIVLSHSGSSGSNSNLHGPGSSAMIDQDVNGGDAIDGAVADESHNTFEATNGPGAAQIHFSGDSQTSQDSKGYSSISVREPLANLKARNVAANVGRQRTGSASRHPQRLQHSESSDPHYATVSDAEDSDEMYAAIAELQPIYDSNAGSDTYAKINDRSEENPPGLLGAAGTGVTAAVVAAPSSPPPAQEAERVGSSPVPPTPPSVVSLKHLSLGAGSSRLNSSTLSIASTASNVGSPKPEKRQANSPLPPPPVHFPADGGDDRSRRSMNVEEMYAKVMKKRGATMHAWQTAGLDSVFTTKQLHRGSVDLGFLTSRDEDAAALLHNSRRNSVDSTPQRTNGSDLNQNVSIIDSEIEEIEGATVVFNEEDDEDDFRYEVLPAVSRSDRKVSESDPGYEKIQLKNADSFSDPRYERILPKNAVSVSEAEPNYEIVGFQCAQISESNEPGYEEVELNSQAFNRQDPNYESLHYTVHEGSVPFEPPYATVRNEVQEIDDEPPQTGESVNNNTVHVPVYAQVVKPKRHDVRVHTVSVVNSGSATDQTGASSSSRNEVENHPDFSVSSSKNTTIIRITDNRPPFRYFEEDFDAFGIPEQV